jgi:hypothetical protein
LAFLAFTAPLPSTISQPRTSGTICLFILARTPALPFANVTAHLVFMEAMSHMSRSEIIKANPTGRGLDAFWKSFSSISKELGLPASPELLNQIGDEGKICGPAMAFC